MALYAVGWIVFGLVRLSKGDSPWDWLDHVFLLLPLWFGPMVLLGLWWIYSTSKERLAELQARAQGAGFEILSEADESFLADVAGFELLTEPGSGPQKCVWFPTQAAVRMDAFGPTVRAVFQVMRKDAGRARITYFEYADQSTSRVHPNTTGSVVQLHSAHLNLPRFSLRPRRRMWDRIAGLAAQSIDFPEHPKFSKMFLLRGADPAAVRAVFSDQLLTFYQNHPDIFTEGEGHQAVVYAGAMEWFPYRRSDTQRLDYIIKAAAFDEFVGQACQIYALLTGPSEAPLP